MLTYSVPPLSPYVTCEEYSRITGLNESTIRDYVSKGKIIIKPKNKRREKMLINMVAMHEIAAREAVAVLG
ncbi:MerR family transcriptional regulator [bacterium 19MO03SA05]|uniref:MerR family transcriptional regulator n=1 Tax=bacterium 19MO03SA05 TaxID=2920620 RepID=A0AAU6VIB5_UNCXX